MKLQIAAIVPALLVGPAISSAADTFIFSLTRESSITIAPSFSVVTEGHLIGNHDATANPTGTQTRPGLFGGSGNNQIPATIDFSLAGSDTTIPAGAFRLTADFTSRVVTLDGLSADLLASEPLDVPLTVGLLFQTFRTISPSSLYIGGARLPVPLGNATISTLTVEQTQAVPGALVPTDTPGVFTFTAIAPATLTASASVLVQTFDLPPTPIALPISGTLDTRPDQPLLTLTWDLEAEQELTPEIIEQLPPIENQPLDLPTILPPGSTAHLLLNLAVTSGTISTHSTATLVAEGAIICPADFNQDGIIDGFDYGDFVEAFESGNPAADFNQDAFVDFFDYSDYVNAFESGC